jgi:hypothetical protein
MSCPDWLTARRLPMWAPAAGLSGVPLKSFGPTALVLMDALASGSHPGSLVDDLRSRMLRWSTRARRVRAAPSTGRARSVVARAWPALPPLLEWCGPLASAARRRVRGDEQRGEIVTTWPGPRGRRVRWACVWRGDCPSRSRARRRDTEPLFAARLLVWEKERRRRGVPRGPPDQSAPLVENT